MSKSPDAFVHNQGPGFKVDPPIVWVTHESGFEFGNATDWAAMLAFPRDVIAGGGDPERQDQLEKLFPGLVGALLARSIRVEPHSRITLQFQPGRPMEVEYSVTVYTDRGPVEAPGCSPPRIIVDP